MGRSNKQTLMCRLCSPSQAGWTPDKLLSWVGPEPTFKAAPQAKETNVYLQYIVSHYDRLPDTIVFIHAHRCNDSLVFDLQEPCWLGRQRGCLD